MCLGCNDDDESDSATRRVFLATALQLTAATALGATAGGASLRDIDARGLTVENQGTLLPAYLATPAGGENLTTVVILSDSPGISRDL